MKTKKIPMRMCVVTREKYPKYDLLRVVKNNDEVVVDKTLKMNGKGAYLKKDKEIILKAQKKKILNQALKIEIPDNIYSELLSLVGENNE